LLDFEDFAKFIYARVSLLLCDVAVHLAPAMLCMTILIARTQIFEHDSIKMRVGLVLNALRTFSHGMRLGTRIVDICDVIKTNKKNGRMVYVHFLYGTGHNDLSR
jgi:hypothetical protein